MPFAKRDFSLLLSALLIAATLFLAFYIFTHKTPNTASTIVTDKEQISGEPVVSNKPLPPRDSKLEFIGDKLSEAEQNLIEKKTAAALHALEQAKTATSHAIENQGQSEKEKLQALLTEVETIEHDIHHNEADEALRKIKQLEKRVETQ